MVSADGKPNPNFALKGERVERPNKTCPKCGDGVFMASHANRLHCGRCGYTEFARKGEQGA
jgi:small subunit ribosomal protein S27Ae